MLFNFASSTHSKYTTYLLEFLTNFELESSQELRETTLNSMLVNLSGMAGAFAEGDIIQGFSIAYSRLFWSGKGQILVILSFTK